MTRLFGTDGIRGEAGVFPFDDKTVELIGASLATNLRERLGRAPAIIIGRDTRESGERIEHALVRGILEAGAISRTAGVVTTPGVAFLTRSQSADAGVVISASHNPYHDNGIKVFSPSGQKLDEETERLIERDVLEDRKFATPPKAEAGPPVTDQIAALRQAYVDFLTKEIGNDLQLNGVRIVIDCANGAASNIAGSVFSRLGAELTSINDRPDGRNINLGCGSLHMGSLRQAVLDRGADLGIAFDGDADRSLFVDAKGNFVNGDATLWVLANSLKKKGQLHGELVVATVMSNLGLEVAFKSTGIKMVRTDVGDKYVLDELLRTGAGLGGEQSGHIIFPKLSLAGDGMITSLCLLRVMTEEEKPLHELTAGFQTFPQILVNVEVENKRPFDQIAEIQETAMTIENKLGARGRLLLRYSGTEPLARVMLEGESQKEIENYASELVAIIKKTLGSQPTQA